MRTFCAQERVPECGFYAWRRELRLRDQEQPPKTPAFVPVVVPQTGADGNQHVVIELRGGRVLRPPVHMPVARVIELVRAVEAAS